MSSSIEEEVGSFFKTVARERDQIFVEESDGVWSVSVPDSSGRYETKLQSSLSEETVSLSLYDLGAYDGMGTTVRLDGQKLVEALHLLGFRSKGTGE